MKQTIRITEDSFFKGSYSGLGDLELHGSFEGSLNVKNLYVKKCGMFIGYVSAENIIVEGEINADIPVFATLTIGKPVSTALIFASAKC